MDKMGKVCLIVSIISANIGLGLGAYGFYQVVIYRGYERLSFFWNTSAIIAYSVLVILILNRNYLFYKKGWNMLNN